MPGYASRALTGVNMTTFGLRSASPSEYTQKIGPPSALGSLVVAVGTVGIESCALATWKPITRPQTRRRAACALEGYVIVGGGNVPTR